MSRALAPLPVPVLAPLPASLLAPLLAIAVLLGAPAALGEEPLLLGGAPATVTPPAGTWERQSESPAPGQWRAVFAHPDRGTVLEARVFPVGGSEDPGSVLMQAADLFTRSLGAGGFGLPDRRVFAIDGRPAAEGSISLVVGDVRLAGLARVVLASPQTWALAWGVARADAPRAESDAVTAFVRSLTPSEPAFYDPSFREREPDLPVVAAEGEEPVTKGNLAAVGGLLEAASGFRLPLGAWPEMRDALLRDAQTGTAKTRKGYRDCGAALVKMMELDPNLRREAMSTLGKVILAAVLTRASEGHPPARDVAALLAREGAVEVGRAAVGGTAVGGAAVGGAADGLRRAAALAWTETASFLASLSRDAPVIPSWDERRERLVTLGARWKDLAPEEKASFRAMEATWPALRHAWDSAAPDARFRFRRAVAAALVPAAQSDRVKGLLSTRDLRAWLDASGPLREPVRLFAAACALTASERSALFQVLGLEDGGYRFGW